MNSFICTSEHLLSYGFHCLIAAIVVGKSLLIYLCSDDHKQKRCIAVWPLIINPETQKSECDLYCFVLLFSLYYIKWYIHSFIYLHLQSIQGHGKVIVSCFYA